MAKGDAYDTGKNTALAATVRNNPETADSGATILVEPTAKKVKESYFDTTGPSGSTILSPDETAYAADEPKKVGTLAFATTGGVMISLTYIVPKTVFVHDGLATRAKDVL